MESLPIENQRVKNVIDFTTKGNVLQFSKEIGISQPRINRLFSIDTRSGKYPLVSFEIVQAIINKFVNINAEWLLTGEGEMLKNAPAPELAPQESHAGADRYTALLEDKIALLEKNNALQERENTYLSEKIKGLENTIKELKSKLQKTIAKQENDIINLQGEDISVMKSPNLPPDDPLQPSRRV